MINIRKRKSYEDLKKPLIIESSDSDTDSYTKGPVFKKYQGTFDHKKFVCDIDEAYDIQHSFDKLDRLNRKVKKIVDV